MNKKEKMMAKLSQLDNLQFILIRMDILIDKIPGVDPFGDMAENFREEDKETNITKRLLEMVSEERARVKQGL